MLEDHRIVLVAVAALGPAFILREREASDPMLDLSLFKRVPFAEGIGCGLLSYLVLFGTLFVVLFYLDQALHQSPGRAGLMLGVTPIALGIAAPFAGWLAEWLGARPLTVAGMALAVATMEALLLAHGSLAAVMTELAVLGIGLGMFTPPNNAAITGSAAREQSGVASGVLNMTRGMGTAMGLAFTSVVFGLVAGFEHASESLVTRGFEASTAFLVALALAARLFAALRGKTGLNLDPVASAE